MSRKSSSHDPKLAPCGFPGKLREGARRFDTDARHPSSAARAVEVARGDILELAVYAGCLLTIGIGMWALFIIIDWVGIDDALSEEALTATRESRGEELHTGSSQLRDVTARRHGEGL